MGAKLEMLKSIKEQILELEAQKEIFKEDEFVSEYIKNKYILDYFNQQTDDFFENEECLETVLTIDRLSKVANVKSYIKVCEKLKLCKNVKSALLTEYAVKTKIKK